MNVKTTRTLGKFITLSLVVSTMIHATNGDNLSAAGAKARGMSCSKNKIAVSIVEINGDPELYKPSRNLGRRPTNSSRNNQTVANHTKIKDSAK